MSRPSKEHYLMSLALLAAQRASCPRRKVGCVLVNGDHHVVSTGYNGPPKGMINCTDVPCGGQHHASGQGLNACVAVHAEINAFEQAGNRLNTVVEMYLTCGPCCPLCTKRFLELYSEGRFSSLQRIYYFDVYPSDTAEKFEALGIELIHLGKGLDPKGFLFKLAVLLGFRSEPAKPYHVLCVGGPLHGQLVAYSNDSNFMRADMSSNIPDVFNTAMKFKSYIAGKPECIGFNALIADYYAVKVTKSNKTFRIFKFADLTDQQASQYFTGLLIENPQLRFL